MLPSPTDGRPQTDPRSCPPRALPAIQLVQTILDQCHLSPLPLSIRPTLWDFDHALRLYPMPTAVRPSPSLLAPLSGRPSLTTALGPAVQLILADKYERYELTYEGCHVFNPGSFIGNSFEWSTYFPSTQRSERRCVPASLRPLRAAL